MMKGLLAAVAVMFVLAVAPSAAAPQPDPSCWFDPPVISPGETSWVLHAANIPTNTSFGISWDPYPAGGGLWAEPDGSFSLTLTYFPGPAGTTHTAYFWMRGRGKTLFKPGAGLNDYRVIAMCSIVEVS